MELNINSPAYFTNVYGIDDEVYKYCQTLHVFFREKEYSDKLKIPMNHAYISTRVMR